MDQSGLRHTLTNLVTLLHVSREIGPATDLDTLLGQIEEATLQTVGCERVTVFIADGQRLRSRLATGEAHLSVSSDQGIVGEAFQTRQVINSPDVTRDSRFNPDIDHATGFRTRNLLAVPLIGYDQKLVGVFELLNKNGGAFTSADEEMATTLASLTAVSLQRQMLLTEQFEMRKLEHELDVARRIQQSLLPEGDPAVDGFDIAGWSKPADATGGDFYDYLGLSEGRWEFVLADVTGYGLGSSLLACECRALIRAIASMTSDLETIIARANEILHGDLKSERFVTLFLGALDASNSTLSYVSAGHPPLFFSPTQGGPCRRLDPTTLTCPPGLSQFL